MLQFHELLMLASLIINIVNGIITNNPNFITIKNSNSSGNSFAFDASSIRFKRSISEIGNTLITSRDIKKGERIIQIPCSMCLLAHREGTIRGLGGQTNKILDICGDLRNSLSDSDIIKGRTWDINLALALLEASCGEGLAGEIEVINELNIPLFWDSYSLDLPKPNEITLPFCMSIDTLNEIQDDHIKNGALQQQMRLSSLFRNLEEPKSWHRITAMLLDGGHSSETISNPLRWAFSIIRSRCFTLLDHWFCIVPIIDMCNHNVVPNARLVVNRNSDSNNDVDILMDPRDYAVCLYALEDIPSEQEISISYGDYDNDRLFVQYGFIVEGNSLDSIKWSFHEQNSTNNDTLSLMKVDITIKAIDSIINDINTDNNNDDVSMHRSIAVRNSIKHGLSIVHSQKELTLIEGLQCLLDDLTTIEKSYPTTLNEDRDIYDVTATNRLQLLMCLKYRTEKKILIIKGKMIIENAIKALKGY